MTTNTYTPQRKLIFKKKYAIVQVELGIQEFKLLETAQISGFAYISVYVEMVRQVVESEDGAEGNYLRTHS